MHYPTDVLAGWTGGAAWALICGVVINRLGRRGVVDVPAAGEPLTEPAQRE
jgi:undecaprenyl-diphosphatase